MREYIRLRENTRRGTVELGLGVAPSHAIYAATAAQIHENATFAIMHVFEARAREMGFWKPAEHFQRQEYDPLMTQARPGTPRRCDNKVRATCQKTTKTTPIARVCEHGWSLSWFIFQHDLVIPTLRADGQW